MSERVRIERRGRKENGRDRRGKSGKERGERESGHHITPCMSNQYLTVILISFNH